MADEKWMNWEHKLDALRALGEISLRMRSPGDWYVAHYGVELKQDSMLIDVYGNGTTPQEAVENHWEIFTSLKRGNEVFDYVVINALDYTRRRNLRWNGYLWEDVVT